MSTEPESNTRPVTVAELLARNGRKDEAGEAPERPGRRHHRREREGGISVAELTGEIPVIREPVIEDRRDRAAAGADVDGQADPADDGAAGQAAVAEADRSDAADAPEVPDEPDAPEAPESSGGPDAPEVPDVPESSNEPDAPEARDEPEGQDEPDYELADADGAVVTLQLDAVGPQEQGGAAAGAAPAALREHAAPGVPDAPAEAGDAAPGASERASGAAEDPAADPQRAEGDAGGRRGTRGQRGAVKQWVMLIAQVIVGVAVGAAVFKGFEELWDALPYVALVLAVLVILGLVAIVRILRKTDDIVSLLLAVVVGVVVTLGPLAFVLSTR